MNWATQLAKQTPLKNFKGLDGLMKVNPGEIFLYSQYLFNTKAEQEKHERDKYFVVMYIDKEEGDVYSFFTTSNWKYYQSINREGCYIKGPRPCYYVEPGGSVGFFPMKTYIQFDNTPEDINHEKLLSLIKKETIKWRHTIPDQEFLQILNCALNSDDIEPYHKKKMQIVKDELWKKLYPEDSK